MSKLSLILYGIVIIIWLILSLDIWVFNKWSSKAIDKIVATLLILGILTVIMALYSIIPVSNWQSSYQLELKKTYHVEPNNFLLKPFDSKIELIFTTDSDIKLFNLTSENLEINQDPYQKSIVVQVFTLKPSNWWIKISKGRLPFRDYIIININEENYQNIIKGVMNFER